MYLTDDRKIGYKLWRKGKVIMLVADFAAKLFGKRSEFIHFLKKISIHITNFIILMYYLKFFLIVLSFS